MWPLFRVLLPSWRFFAFEKAIPKLYARTVQTGQLGSSWLPVLNPPRLRWYSLFINPQVNLYHSYCNALERLVQDPEDEYARRLIHRLVRRFLCHDRGAEESGRYQFKVTVIQIFDGKAVEEDVLAGEGDL